MKKIVVASDSFKGTISSIKIGEIVKAFAAEKYPECEVVCVPVADGGEGTVDSFIHAMNAEEKRVPVNGPLGDKVNAKYAIIGDTAIIEMAQAAGLPLVESRKNPLLTSTFGVGEIIKDAADNGCRRILLGLGGSSTNDCGCGMAAALGVKFFDKNGEAFIPTGGTLKDVSRIDKSGLDKRYSDISFTAMCDVTNPLYGSNGAAYVYGPQKGADQEMVMLLDEGLRSFSKFLDENIPDTEGSGAAGGMGAGCMEFLHAKLEPGAKAILDAAAYDSIAKDATIVISGEGRADFQSMQGKLLSELSRRAEENGVQLVVIAGEATADAKAWAKEKNIDVFETSPEIRDHDERKAKAVENYVKTLERVLNKYFE